MFQLKELYQSRQELGELKEVNKKLYTFCLEKMMNSQ